jgi:hypothetical protein
VVNVVDCLEVVGRIYQIVRATTPTDPFSLPHPVHTLNGGLAGAIACWTVGMGAAGGKEGGGLREGVVVAWAGGFQEECGGQVPYIMALLATSRGAATTCTAQTRDPIGGAPQGRSAKKMARVKSRLGNPKVTVIEKVSGLRGPVGRVGQARGECKPMRSQVCRLVHESSASFYAGHEKFSKITRQP